MCGMASVVIWLAVVPLYLKQPPASVYDGAATAAALASIRTLVFNFPPLVWFLAVSLSLLRSHA